MNNTRPNIHLHIEQLLLDGLDIGPGQGTKVKASAEAELMRLLTEGGLASSFYEGGVMPSVEANPIQINRDANPSRLGVQIAEAIYRGIGK